MKLSERLARLNPLLGVSVVALGLALAAQPAQAEPRQFNVPSEDAVEAIPEFARQAGVQIVAPADRLHGVQTPAVQGAMEPRDALQHLLSGTGLEVASDDGRVITLRASAQGQAIHPTQLGDATAAPSDAGATADILVIGHRTQNADIRRTRDDTQPYVVFDGQQIANSGAVNLEEFLATHLPMNTQNRTTDQITGALGGLALTQGNIDLRGLGANQTLILVDGRRLPDVSLGGSFAQPNINGIPPASIERIEILPATASAIYGGSATGGVINIILKRDYSGLDLNASYGDTFDTDVGAATLGVSGGSTFNNGHTHVMFNLSHASSSDLLTSDRDFTKRHADLLSRNDPNAFFAVGANVCSTMDTFAGDDSCDGAPLVLDNGTPLNSNRTYVPRGYAGPLATGDGGAAFLNNAGRVDASYAPTPLWSAPTTDAASLNVRHTFTDAIEGYFDFSRTATKNSLDLPQATQIILPADAANNPFQQDVLINVPLPEAVLHNISTVLNWSASAGAIIRLPHAWSASVEYQRSESVVRTSFASAFGVSASAQSLVAGASLTDTRSFPPGADASALTTFSSAAQGDTSLETFSGRFSGPLFNAPGGEVTMSALLERRDERTASVVGFGEFSGFSFFSWNPPAEQQVESGYAEIHVPIVSTANALPLVQALDFTVAARHDAYDTNYPGTGFSVAGKDGPFPTVAYTRSQLESTDYTLGLRYSPMQDITFRASYGTGFLPPTLSQLLATPLSPTPASNLFATDPRRGGEALTGDSSGSITVGTFANRTVAPEQSRSLSYGLIFTPRLLEGIRLSLDYTEIHKSDEIIALLTQQIIDNEAFFSSRVVRGPNLPGDPAGYAGPIIGLDVGPVNAAATDVRAIDFQVDYDRHTSDWGDWHFYLIGTRQTRFQRTLLPGAAALEYAGLVDGPVEWRGVYGVDWTQGPWVLGWSAQYTGSYSPCASSDDVFSDDPTSCAAQKALQGANHVPAQIYNDVSVRYQFAQSNHNWGGVLDGAELSFGIQNIFNQEPPVLARPGSVYSGYGDPRLRRFTLSLREHF